MKWLRYRSTWAWGYNDWAYRPLYTSKVNKEAHKEIEEEIDDMSREHQWSDKFRGVEWEIINTRRVPNIHIEAIHARLKSSIGAYKNTIKRLRDNIPLIDALKGKGRKTCPDEMRHAKRKRLREMREKRTQR